jgi:hypothetical protein
MTEQQWDPQTYAQMSWSPESTSEVRPELNQN